MLSVLQMKQMQTQLTKNIKQLSHNLTNVEKLPFKEAIYICPALQVICHKCYHRGNTGQDFVSGATFMGKGSSLSKMMMMMICKSHIDQVLDNFKPVFWVCYK